MCVQERIRIVRIIEKIEKNKEFSKRIGIHAVSKDANGRSLKRGCIQDVLAEKGM